MTAFRIVAEGRHCPDCASVNAVEIKWPCAEPEYCPLGHWTLSCGACGLAVEVCWTCGGYDCETCYDQDQENNTAPADRLPAAVIAALRLWDAEVEGCA